MKNQILKTTDSLGPLALRIVLGAIILVHGLDKVGDGFQPFISLMTDTLNMPAILGYLTVFIETASCIMLIFGFATRVNAALMFGLFVGLIACIHWSDGFLMNWFGQMDAGKEGYEYHLLVLAMSLSLFITGSGKFSIDKYLIK